MSIVHLALRDFRFDLGPPLRPLMVLLGIFCAYVGGMSTLGLFFLGGWRRLLGYASLVFSVVCASAIASLLVHYVAPPSADEATKAFFQAEAFSLATSHLLVAEFALALIASPPLLISRLKR